jgi:hypothetical protein
MKTLSPPCPVGTTAVLYVNKTTKSTRWKWAVCTIKLLNPCCLSLLALKCRSILIRLMRVLMVVILLLRVLSCLNNLSSMGMVVRVLELLLRVMREVLLHRRVITLLLLLRVLRESLSVVRGGIFDYPHPSFVFAASCIAMVFCSFLSKQKEMVLFFGFSRYPTYMMREGQVAGSSCPFSFLCLYLIIRIRLRCHSPVTSTLSRVSTFLRLLRATSPMTIRL